MPLPDDFTRCAPLDECPWADDCARLRDIRPGKQYSFSHFGPPLDAHTNPKSRCHYFVKGQRITPAHVAESVIKKED